MLSAQDAVQWQQRGSVTSSVSFFRTIGGAVGVGVLGALFNVLIAPQLGQFADRGIAPATLLDPHLRNRLPPDVIASAQSMIAGALLWVFAAMLAVSVLQVVVALMMREGKCEHEVKTSEAMEALA
jgi:hypothetical protein